MKERILSYRYVLLLAGLMFAAGAVAGVLGVRVAAGDATVFPARGSRAGGGSSCDEGNPAARRASWGRDHPDGRRSHDTGSPDGSRMTSDGGRGPGGHGPDGRGPDGRGPDGRDGRGRGPDGHGSDSAGHLRSMREMAESVDLREDQREQLSQIVRDAADRIADHERQIADELAAARRAVDGLLDDEQRSKLDQRMRSFFDKYREARVQELVEWLTANAQLDADQLAKARDVISRWIDAKGNYFRSQRMDHGWPSPDEVRSRMRDLEAARDAELSGILSAETLAAFREVASRRSRR